MSDNNKVRWYHDTTTCGCQTPTRRRRGQHYKNNLAHREPFCKALAADIQYSTALHIAQNSRVSWAIAATRSNFLLSSSTCNRKS